MASYLLEPHTTSVLSLSETSKLTTMPRRSSIQGSTHARRPAKARSSPPAKARSPPPREVVYKVIRSPSPAKRSRSTSPEKCNSGGSMLGSIARGMVYGTAGCVIALGIVHALTRPQTAPIKTVASETASASAAVPAAGSNMGESDEACGMQSKAFQDCLNDNANDISNCQFYYEMLSECKKNSGPMMS